MQHINKLAISLAVISLFGCSKESNTAKETTLSCGLPEAVSAVEGTIKDSLYKKNTGEINMVLGGLKNEFAKDPSKKDALDKLNSLKNDWDSFTPEFTIKVANPRIDPNVKESKNGVVYCLADIKGNITTPNDALNIIKGKAKALGLEKEIEASYRDMEMIVSMFGNTNFDDPYGTVNYSAQISADKSNVFTESNVNIDKKVLNFLNSQIKISSGLKLQSIVNSFEPPKKSEEEIKAENDARKAELNKKFE